MRKDVFEHAVELRKSGATLLQIANRIGYSRSRVSRVFSDAGLSAPRTGRSQPSADLIKSVASAVEVGRPYGEIAQELGLTRGQVAGLIHRNFPRKDRTQPAASSAKSVPATRGDTGRRVRVSSEVAADTPAPLPPAPQPVPKAAPPVVASSPVAFALAGPGICHWPLWSATDALPAKTVCGTACGREVYCPAHRALAYRPAESRRRAA